MATEIDPTTKQDVKYRRIFTDLHRAIKSGKYAEGERLPSEAQLTRTYDTSRITVARALKELSILGLVERKAGSGTFVRHAYATQGRTFGLLIPDLGETEIFEPICQGIARASRATHDEILWGAAGRDVESKVEQALQLCDYYRSKEVAGVFFATVEHVDDADEINREIIDNLQRSSIPIVLLDRDICGYAQRSGFDLVGIDHRWAGLTVTQHLLKLGCEQIVFVGLPQSAPSVAARIAGYREAMWASKKEWSVEIGLLDPPIG